MKQYGRLLMTVAIVGVLVTLAGCSSDSDKKKLPEGATVISDDVYDTYLSQDSLTEITEGDQEEQDSAIESKYEEAAQEIDDFITRTGVDPRPSEPNANQEDDSVEILPDESIRHTIRLKDGSSRDVVTLGWKQSVTAIGEGLRIFPERTNQAGIYRHLYESTPSDVLSRIQENEGVTLPSPDAVDVIGSDITLEKINEYNDYFVAYHDSIISSVVEIPEIPPLVYDCSSDIGTGDGGDRSGCQSTCGYNADGIFLNYDWKYKEYLTCVKDQGPKRGTCCAFAVISATEYWVSRRLDAVVNLSEQALYNRMKLNWVRDDKYDGYYISDALDYAISEGYLIPFEYQWNYNPSLNRTNKQGGGFYHSCDNYADTCSNSSHQSEIVCNGANDCSYYVPEKNAGNYGIRIKSGHVIWDWNDKEKSFWRVIIYLAMNDPVIIQVPVLAQFDAARETGYVSYQAGDVDNPSTPNVNESTNRGNHIMHVVSYIDNNDLPEGAPDGAGGGYLIVKNSWSNCWGDGGYVYLPYNYLKEYGQYGSVLTKIWEN